MFELVSLVLWYTSLFFFWFMLGRVVLAVISGGKRTFFSDLFQRATFPAFWVVRRVTPSSVGDKHIPILSIPLLLALVILLRPVRPVGGGA
jgi:hypothetical protein